MAKLNSQVEATVVDVYFLSYFPAGNAFIFQSATSSIAKRCGHGLKTWQDDSIF